MKRKSPEYKRFVEFGSPVGKPREFLKGFLTKKPKSISASLEVDHRKALMGKMSDDEFWTTLKAGKTLSSGIATGDGGTAYPRPSSTWKVPSGSLYGSGIYVGGGSTGSTITTPFAGGSGWYGGTGSVGTVSTSSTWTLRSPWFIEDEFSVRQREAITEAICEEIRKNTLWGPLVK